MPADMNDYFKKKGGGFNGGNSPKIPNETPDFIKNFGQKAGIVYAIIGIVFLLLIAKPYVIINSGEVGILKTLGKYQDEPLHPGFHFLAPFVQRVIIVDTKLRQTNYNKAELIGNRGGIIQKPPISILDSRGLPVEIELTVQYKIKPEIAPVAIANLGLNWEDKTVNPNARDVVRSVIGNYTAEELPIKRNIIAAQIEQGMVERLKKLEGDPVELVAVQLRGIILPEKIKEQIERVQIANQEAERVKYEVLKAQQEAQKKAALAKGEADKKRIEAQGIADAVTIEAEAQAKANKLISQSLTTNLLKLEQIKTQAKFNEALKENKDAKIFLTPGGSTPNIWVDNKEYKKQSMQAQ